MDESLKEFVRKKAQEWANKTEEEWKKSLSPQYFNDKTTDEKT